MRSARRPALLVVLIVLLAIMLIPPAAAAAAPSESPSEHGTCAQWYTVRKGDTLTRIANRYGTSVWRLMNLNGLHNPDFVFWGQSLCVKAANAKPAGFWYRVKWGDTLARIGWRYGWSSTYLARVNGISNPNNIVGGRSIWIPYH